MGTPVSVGPCRFKHRRPATVPLDVIPLCICGLNRHFDVRLSGTPCTSVRHPLVVLAEDERTVVGQSYRLQYVAFASCWPYRVTVWR